MKQLLLAMLLLGALGSLRAQSPAIQPVFGPQHVLVMLVTFDGSEPYSGDDASDVIKQVNAFYWRASYQQTSIVGDVVGWYTIPYDGVGCDKNRIASLAEEAATAAGVNVAAYPRRVYAFPHTNCGWAGFSTFSGVTPSRIWSNGEFSLRVVGHEMGHNFGLTHEDGLDCGREILRPGCRSTNQANRIGLMGSGRGDFNLFSKERVGFVGVGSSPPITTVVSDGTFWIETLEAANTGQSKGVKIARGVRASSREMTSFYVEHREGFPAC